MTNFIYMHEKIPAFNCSLKAVSNPFPPMTPFSKNFDFYLRRDHQKNFLMKRVKIFTLKALIEINYFLQQGGGGGGLDNDINVAGGDLLIYSYREMYLMINDVS